MSKYKYISYTDLYIRDWPWIMVVMINYVSLVHIYRISAFIYETLDISAQLDNLMWRNDNQQASIVVGLTGWQFIIVNYENCTLSP